MTKNDQLQVSTAELLMALVKGKCCALPTCPILTAVTHPLSPDEYLPLVSDETPGTPPGVNRDIS